MKRSFYIKQIKQAFHVHPIVAILGPRQCGKTTLAKQYLKTISGQKHFFDLEDPEDLAALEHPKPLFESLKGILILDEIQRKPEIFPYLRSFIDRFKRKRKILILGSTSRSLLRQSSETLAGRIAYLELTPFLFFEVLKKK